MARDDVRTRDSKGIARRSRPRFDVAAKLGQRAGAAM
jgi:hypothetical protein